MLLTEYTEAITDNNVARLAVAPTVRVTSNGQVVDLGKGPVWSGPKVAVPPGLRRSAQRRGGLLWHRDDDEPARPRSDAARGRRAPEHAWFYVVRLRVVLQRITEVEEVSYEPPQGGLARTLPH